MRRRAACLIVLTAVWLFLAAAPGSARMLADNSSPASVSMTFAVIGDYGMDDANESAVASLVASWDPDYIITTGDDYYTPAGGTGTGMYDESTGAYFGAWLKDISTTGVRCPVGLAPVNAFFPSMGNHDYTDATPAPDTYLTYFTLPGVDFTNTSGNERYYDFVEGPVHFFVLNSCEQEPDGTSSASTQAQWLQTQLASSTSEWNIVYDHHPPYSSDNWHGSTSYMQWPFASWGADAVLSGHSHTYERIVRDGIVYLVNGAGGAALYGWAAPVAGSMYRDSATWGAQRVTVTSSTVTFDYYNVGGVLLDSCSLPEIIASAAQHGSISPAGETNVSRGTSQSFTITPDAGYHVSDVVIDSTTHLGSVTSHTFTDVQSAHTISATFAANPIAVHTPVARRRMSHRKYYKVYGYLNPRHASGTYPVRIYRWKKKSSGGWKSYGYVTAKASNYSSYTKYSKSMKLTRKGKWRIRAYAPQDGQHLATWSSGYDYVTVY